MLLNQDQEMIRDALRDFVREQITPHAARWDKEHEFPKEVHQGLAALGAYGICVPEELGGAGLDYVSLALVLEEIAAGDGGTSTVISVTNCPVNAILMKYGNASQQEQWLRPLAQGQMLGAFCLTEPHVGRCLGAAYHGRARWRRLRHQRRQAVHHQRQEWRCGHRHRRHRQGGGQERHECLHRAHRQSRLPGGTPGRQAGPAQQRYGADQFRELPHSRREPDRAEGEGYKIALSALEGGRIGIAAQSVGMARAAFECALQYSKERESFGQPIFNHQAVGFRLAECATQIEAAATDLACRQPA
jgi:alkylation response protein AidB-like acyl-CoA dehydrogenase